MTDEHIEYLQRTRKLLSAELDKARAPDGERVPEPRVGERVVFGTQFLVVFELRRSCFPRHFLEFCGLEMHHVGPNSVMYLTCFAMPCEAYLGFSPFPSFFRHLFHFHA
ncbi:hypothetical protein D1007_10524 [Hordeum vulgare]|nr:hypothetical protein D1007_10524 [Hordeum vulgare]